jgi:transcriptional regulator with XRE-family HTH domain
MEIDGRQIPNRLKEHRIIHGLLQKDVSGMLGHKNSSLLSKWENGEAKPGLVNLLKLCSIYSVLPADLYFDVFEQQQQEIATRRLAHFGYTDR